MVLTSWLPALDDIEAKLKAGASVADVGRGHGASTLLMARAFLKSKFHGFDYHSGSIEYARHVWARDCLQDQVTFEVASSKSYPGNGGYDLVIAARTLRAISLNASAHNRVFSG